MSTEQNKAVVRRYIEEVINKGNLDLIDTLFAPNMREKVRDFLTNGGDPFPDGQEEIKDMLAEGDKVMVWWLFRGTHQGEFLGIPATGKPFEIVGFAVYDFENGQIVDDLMRMDWYDMLTQVGAQVALPGS